MRFFIPIVCFSILALPLAAQDEAPIFGFDSEQSAIQRSMEEQMRQSVNAENYGAYLRSVAGHLNLAGTPGSYANALYLKEQLEEFGYAVQLYPYHVYLPHPVRTELIVHGQQGFVIKPGEAGIASDEHSRTSMTPFSAFSPSGTVRAEVVYVNYGRSEDFDHLLSEGIDLNGKIALCRYGKIFRGSKVTAAENHGMAGVILYSDPEDDGYVRGDVYPDGRFRPADGIQRGSVINMVANPGDPLTPLEPSLEYAQRLAPKDAALPGIPVLPLGYEDAGKLFQRIAGADIPQDWQGGLPLRYHIGPGPLQVTLDVEVDYAIRKIWNTMAILEGAEEPDSWVLAGCHRDAWLHGAQDPHSGTAVLLETARVIAEAVKEHGPMRRSLVFCSWDAEEYGMIGSIELVEHLKQTLDAKALVYLNADAMISGSRFWAAATPTLTTMFDQVLREVHGPDGQILFEAWHRKQLAQGTETEYYKFGQLGGGSDHSGFLHHLAIPVLASGFGGGNGIYHSAYDTVVFTETHGDPGYKSHAAGSRLLVTLLSRLANATIIPLDPGGYARQLREDMHAYQKMYGEIASEHQDAYNTSIDKMTAVTAAYVSTLKGIVHSGDLTAATVRALNQRLLRLERSFLMPEGVPGRPWYRNVVNAVDEENGYARQVFPALVASQSDTAGRKVAMQQLFDALNAYTEAVEKMNQMLDIRQR